MDQNAFRNLLNSAATTRPPPRESGVDGGGNVTGGSGGGGGGGKNKTWKPRPKPVKDGSNSFSLGEKTNESSKFQFRDRADERRKGLHAEEDEAEEALYKSLGVEESKFLGGDLAHTHLVKGLDFALLAKMRREAGSTSTITNTTTTTTTTTKGGVNGVQATASAVHATTTSSSLSGTSRVMKSRNSNDVSQSSSTSSSSLFAKSILEAVAASLQLQQQQQQQNLSSSSSSLAVSSTTQYAHSRFLPGRTTFSYSCAANAAADCALLFANAEEADSLPTIATRETTYSERKTLVIDHPNAEIEDRVLEALFKHRVIRSGRRKRIATMAQQDSLPFVAVNDNDATHQSEKIKASKDNFINKVKEEEEEEEDIFSGIGTYSTVVASSTVTAAPKTAETLHHSKEAPFINSSKATLIDKSSMLITSSTLNSSSTAGSVVSESTRPSRFSATASAAATTVSSSRVTEFEKDKTHEKKPALPPVSSHNMFAPPAHQQRTQSTPARFCDPLLRATLDHGLGGLEGFDEWDELEHSGKLESLVELRRKADEKKQFDMIHGGGGGGGGGHSTSSSAVSQKNPRPSVTSQPKGGGLGSVLNRNVNEDEDDGLMYGNSSRKRQHEYENELIDEEEEEREKVDMEDDDGNGEGKQVIEKEVAPRTEDDLLDEQFERHKPLINSSSSTQPLSLSSTTSSTRASHVDADILALRSGSFSMLGGAREEAMAAVIAAKAAARNAKAEAMIGGRKQQFVPSAVSATSKASAATSSSSSSWRPGSWNNDEGNDDDDDDGDGSDGGGGGGGKGGTNNNNNNKRARIDTELSQINRLLEDRKSSGGGGGGKIPTQPSLKHKKGKGSTYDED